MRPGCTLDLVRSEERTYVDGYLEARRFPVPKGHEKRLYDRHGGIYYVKRVDQHGEESVSIRYLKSVVRR